MKTDWVSSAPDLEGEVLWLKLILNAAPRFYGRRTGDIWNSESQIPRIDLETAFAARSPLKGEGRMRGKKTL